MIIAKYYKSSFQSSPHYKINLSYGRYDGPQALEDFFSKGRKEYYLSQKLINEQNRLLSFSSKELIKYNADIPNIKDLI